MEYNNKKMEILSNPAKNSFLPIVPAAYQSSLGTRNSQQYKHRLVADLYDDLAVVYPIHIDLSQGVKMLKIKS